MLFDEFHERHLAGDLGLALALDVQAGLREDLRIVVMSATLDGERLAAFLDAPRLSSAGRSFPVEIAHFPARRDEALEQQARRAIEHALAAHPGDVLVFLPGQREIAQVATRRWPRDAGGARASTCLPLHGDLPVEQQSRVLQPAPDGRRRVVLATNVAESSVTLPGVRVVIDGGLAREPRFDPNSGFSRLDSVAISQASRRPARRPRRPRRGRLRLSAVAAVAAAGAAAQTRDRAGGAGRAGAGAGGLGQQRAALRRSAAAGRAGGGHATCCSGWTRLRRWQAHRARPAHAGARHASASGGDAAGIRTSPRELALACDLAALVEARDPLRSRSRRTGRALAGAGRIPQWTRACRCQPFGALAAIDAAAKQWRRRLRCDAAPPAAVPAHALGDLLAHAFPDRIAQQHPQRPAPLPAGERAHGARCSTTPRCTASRGWSPANCASKPRTRCCCAPRRWTRRGCAPTSRRASPTPTRCAGMRRSARWSQRTRSSASTASCWRSKSAGRVDPAQAARALTGGRARAGPGVLPWSDGLSQWRIARAMPARLDAGAGRCRIFPTPPCWPRWSAGCSRRSTARPGWMRWTPARWPKR